MDNDIKEIKFYIESNDYDSLEEFLSVFMIPLKKIQNEEFDILCYSIEKGCSDELIKQIYMWCNIKTVDYCYSLNEKFISPLLCSFIYKKYKIVEFLIEKGANINRKYNNVSLLKYLINNKYFDKKIISILVRNQYIFDLKDFDALFKENFDLIKLTFEEITLYNKSNKSTDNYNDEKDKKKRKEKKKEKEKNEIFKQEITIPYMWYINCFKNRKFKEVLYLFKYETSEQRLDGIKFFDNHFKYIEKKEKNDIKLEFLYEISKKHIEIPIFKNGKDEKNEKFIREKQIKMLFQQALNEKKNLYKKILSNKKIHEINKFENNHKFFLKIQSNQKKVQN